MAMTSEQIQKLIQMITSVQPDQLDCDGCHEQLAEFAEHQLLGKSLSESEQAVKQHLQNCACCDAVFQQLLDALKGMDDE